jgi:hypothetical protein
MNAKYRVLWISLFVIVLFAGLSVTQAQTGAKADVVTAISNLENDGVKADLAGDPAFYQKVLLAGLGLDGHMNEIPRTWAVLHRRLPVRAREATS